MSSRTPSKSKGEKTSQRTIAATLRQALNKVPKGKSVTIHHLAQETGLHWNTVKRFVEMIYDAQNFLPIIELLGEDIAVKVIDLSRMPNTRCYLCEPDRDTGVNKHSLLVVCGGCHLLVCEKHYLHVKEKLVLDTTPESFGGLRTITKRIPVDTELCARCAEGYSGMR